MLVILSPAKKLLAFSKPYTQETTTPLLIDKANDLAQLMKSKSENDLASMMDLSDELAALNFSRYQSYDLQSAPSNASYPAIYLFQGDVYQGLEAKTWDDKTIAYAKNHLAILSGLYGILRPLDRIQPYRLEMGVKVENPAGTNLYDYWKKSVTDVLNHQLSTHLNPMLINLASNEYSKAVDEKQLNYPMITINFYETKNNQHKIIGIFSKKARGVMARYIMQNQIGSVTELKKFNELGYQFHQETSSNITLNFVR
jgi:uncharacterized protein